ncbi:MAG: FHA domain-containing protein [Acidobacteriota bacterium]
MPFLLHRTAAGQTRQKEIDGEVLSIGRGAQADLRLDDPAVAFDHAWIETERSAGGVTGWVLIDRRSVTGTYHNGQPVTRTPLAAGDRIEIGGFRITVRRTDPGEPLVVHLERPADGQGAEDTGSSPPPSARPTAAATESAPPVARIDYVRAYALARPGLTKASLTLGLTALTVLLLAGALLAGHRGWFMPGISSAHGRIVAPGPLLGGETADPASVPLSPRVAAAAELGCLACHQPWQGAVDTGCAECHSSEALPHAAGVVATPSCATCHPEHRPGQPLIEQSEETGCVNCHGNLTVAEGEPRIASRITSFAADHPELTVTPLAAGTRGASVSLDAPGARGTDPGRLAFNHRIHLAASLTNPQGSVQLACADCHTVAASGGTEGSGRMAPIAFTDHCQSCHLLTFDADLPDRQAPHGTPQEVEDFLVGLYSRADSVGADRSLRARRLGFIARGGRQRLSPGIDRQVADAARTLFRSQCAVCHRMDLDAVPLPTVEPPGLPQRWFARAGFSHLDHGEVGCNECHRGVAQSQKTSDVLLPGIAECRSCHGAGPTTADSATPEAARWGGLLGCAQCHGYHAGHPPTIASGGLAGVDTGAVGG